MSDRNDRKLQQVSVGSYIYRHEAEFAAGFLKSAGIPYRLQIEDPTLGLSASESATLWVHAMDEGRARALLDQETALQEEGDDQEDQAAELPGEGASAEAGRPGEEGVGEGSDRGDEGPSGIVWPHSGTDVQANMKPDLTLRERLLAIVAALGASSLLGVDKVIEAHPAMPWIVALIAIALVLIGVLGRAPGPLKALLSTLSGDVP